MITKKVSNERRRFSVVSPRVILLYAFGFILSIILSSSLATAKPWTKDKKIAFSLSSAAVIADWGTTLDIKNYDNMYEMNPIMGRHPRDSTVHLYFLGTLATHYLIANYLEHPWDMFFLGATFYTHGGAAFRNYGAGLRIKF